MFLTIVSPLVHNVLALFKDFCTTWTAMTVAAAAAAVTCMKNANGRPAHRDRQFYKHHYEQQVRCLIQSCIFFPSDFVCFFLVCVDFGFVFRCVWTIRYIDVICLSNLTNGVPMSMSEHAEGWELRAKKNIIKNLRAEKKTRHILKCTPRNIKMRLWDSPSVSVCEWVCVCI